VDEARLVSRSCTTGWLAGTHGELWLTDTALVRTRLTQAADRVSGKRGITPTIPAVQVVPTPPHLRPEALRAAGRSVTYVELGDVLTARLHRGRFSDRLSLEMRSGEKHKLLWLTVDPAYDVLRAALAESLGDRLELD